MVSCLHVNSKAEFSKKKKLKALVSATLKSVWTKGKISTFFKNTPADQGVSLYHKNSKRRQRCARRLSNLLCHRAPPTLRSMSTYLKWAFQTVLQQLFFGFHLSGSAPPP